MAEFGITLSAELSGRKAVRLSWTTGGQNANFEVFWKSNLPAGQAFVLLASTNAFEYTTADLESSKIYSFYIRAFLGAEFFYSNTVELFVSCGKGVVLSVDPPESPPPIQRESAIDVTLQELWSYRSDNFPYGIFVSVADSQGRIYHSYRSHFNGSYMVYDHFHDSLYYFFNVNIPQGAEVYTANLRLYQHASPGSSARTAEWRVKGRDVDDCPYPTQNTYPTPNDGTAWLEAAVAKTSAYGSFVLAAGTYNVPGQLIADIDIKSILQEIVNRPGCVSGNKVGLYFYYAGDETINLPDSGLVMVTKANESPPPELLYSWVL